MTLDAFLHEQLNRGIDTGVFDRLEHGDQTAALLVDAATVLVRAGLTLAVRSPTTVTSGSWSPTGVGMEITDVDGRRAVMVAWGMSDAADYRTVDIMLGAVAEVLRVHGFAVERHPAALSYIIVGRA
ncbi:hypothetical protein NE236_42000 [Actinoallomurus purpureus]|uniref:hypothetical protein n=1 Tax=Actinoallomurus purpureus TaxID=478114 RepID=UPI0020931F9A|nr:hypothetical protein [Actinoallomurus purpureus]MCO6011545.1 hypothetical protein [Actinoallomurus purpureus]